MCSYVRHFLKRNAVNERITSCRERHLHYFLNSCWDIPRGRFPLLAATRGSLLVVGGDWILRFRALMKIQLRNEVVLTMKNVDSQIPPFRAVCTIPDFKVRRTLLGLMWCDIKALTQPDKNIVCFSCICALVLVHLSQRLVSSIFLKPAAFIHVSHQSDRFSIWWYTTPSMLAERLAE